jgi:hypothetical protein
MIDQGHPAAWWKAHAFPEFCCPAFTLRAVQKNELLRLNVNGRVLHAQRFTMVIQQDWK